MTIKATSSSAKVFQLLWKRVFSPFELAGLFVVFKLVDVEWQQYLGIILVILANNVLREIFGTSPDERSE